MERQCGEADGRVGGGGESIVGRGTMREESDGKRRETAGKEEIENACEYVSNASRHEERGGEGAGQSGGHRGGVRL